MENYGAYDGKIPSYASALLYELHEKQPGKFTVEVWYVKDQGETPPTPVSIKGCGGVVCDLDTFLSIARSHSLPENDYYSACGLTQGN